MQPVMNVNWPTSTLQMEKSEGSSSSGPMKMSMRLLQTYVYTTFRCETLLGKPLLLVHRVILIVENFGTHYMEFFVRMWFIFRYLI